MKRKETTRGGQFQIIVENAGINKPPPTRAVSLLHSLTKLNLTKPIFVLFKNISPDRERPQKEQTFLSLPLFVQPHFCLLQVSLGLVL